MKKKYDGFSINQIAQDLNLSRSTVSKVVNQVPGVSEKNRKLVQDYISSLSKAASASAGLMSGDSSPAAMSPRTILFTYNSNSSNHVEYINGLLEGMEKIIKKEGHMLALHIVTGSRKPFFPDSVYNGNVSGIISFNNHEEPIIEELESLPVPVVLFDMPYSKDPVHYRSDVVSTENAAALCQVIRLLHEKGRKRFGYFGYPQYCCSMNERWRCFQDTLSELRLPLIPELCFLDDYDSRPGIDITRVLCERIRSLPSLPDVFICASDKQAIMMNLALKELGISVPGQTALVGFDNLPESLRQSPQLTTIDAHASLQGEMAARLLLDRIINPERPPLILRCQTQLLLRGSTDI